MSFSVQPSANPAPQASASSPAQPPAQTQPPAHTQASKLGKLLDALAGLLEQIEAEEDAAGASDQLIDLFNQSDLDLIELLEASREIQQALADIKNALTNASHQTGSEADSLEQAEKLKKLAAALARIEAIYVERNRRQLEQNFSDLWRLIYLDRRQRHQDIDPDALTAPAGLDPAQVRAAVSDPAELNSTQLLELLNDQTFEADPAEKALLLHEAGYRLIAELLADPPSLNQAPGPQAQQALNNIDELGELIMLVRTALAAR